MALNSTEKQDLKALVKEYAVNWFLQTTPIQCPYPQNFCCFDAMGETVHFYRYLDTEQRTVERYPESSIVLDLINFSDWLSKGMSQFHELGFDAVLSESAARHCVAVIKGRLTNHKDTGYTEFLNESIRPIGDTPGYIPDNDWAFVRLPISFTVSPERFGIFQARECGDFIAGLMSRMADFDGEHSLMFDVLMCFIARTITENTPSRQFVYWYGPGGDGKGTLLMWLIDMLKTQATTIGHELFESRFGPGTFGHKRLVCVEEVTRGNFFTERVKELTGNEFVSVERKGKDFEQIRNRMCIIFTSNHKPSFDGTTSQRGRIRYVCSRERNDNYEKSAEMLRDELQAYGGEILKMAIATYRHYNETIPQNPPEDLEEIMENYFSDADGVITKFFQYKKGAFVPVAVIREIIGRRSFSQFEQRIKAVLQPQAVGVDDEVKKTRRRVGANPVFGWANIGLRGDTTSGYNFQGRWIEK